jgi:hypothetical protein
MLSSRLAWSQRDVIQGWGSRPGHRAEGLNVGPSIDADEVIAFAQGAGFALAADITMTRLIPRRRSTVAALGLVAAAAAYPLSRRRLGMDAGETVTLAAAAAMAAATAWLPSRIGRRVLGVGWIAHAAYDAVFTHDPTATRLPTTYAASCAGADIVLGARLLLA